MGASLNGIQRRAALAVCLGGMLAIGVSQAAARPSAAPRPTAHTACRHFESTQPGSPCRIGNVLVDCGYRLGACEYSKYLRCKISAYEEGTVVKYPVDPGEGIEGTRLENPHKKVICKGSATILKSFYWEFPDGYQVATVHSAHSLSVTLYYRHHGFRDDGLVIFAQH